MSGAEEQALTRAAELQRVSVPRLLVESALAVGEIVDQGPGPAAEGEVGQSQRALAGHVETVTQRRDLLAELFRIERLLGAVSRNVNQLTKVAHATGVMQPETAGALGAIRRIVGRIDQTLDALAVGGRGGFAPVRYTPVEGAGSGSPDVVDLAPDLDVEAGEEDQDEARGACGKPDHGGGAEAPHEWSL